ncbi:MULTISPECIES: sugar transferase [unclassified Clostridioides]|uniref:sugar transferase n=1 Tax=unclassified Clostridioides TaxID=2635829 RepID=UPI001D0C5030|nr:sugar transferase [Clostridioides sp. ES-S-0001-02]MCC0639471.1 sugar transferase [Clostridioides sp. ES-S-0049-03]MCC0651486.1 sugar transferase [Clostridioides sp. ES-S-0001-03]MCC0655716.1 sugar transferase [Clostridioides sp. ES-S-0123-01]MCC0674009.1 sugar transferase [Clostridioides sp. ES-S-0145-01]MCC0676603.1 sugar transferase [Clostridioides sp. ES-W-0018-02]MCC0680520.1 sugar transferase [Clostridioides sp. ES-S-0005-03]MCC0694885.1 sugar transferase [Clostridioides sp. ES-S-00
MSGYTNDECEIPKVTSYPGADKEIASEIDYSIVKGTVLFDLYQRVVDLVLSILGLVVGLPLIAIFGILIKIEDKGPITYKQERLGKCGRRFYIYKLRSMRTDAEKFGAQWAEKDDPRITKVGKFIRKTRIDEIPQLFNILKGDMGLIGPRPERPNFTVQFNEEIPGFINRLAIKPGLTGWAQVNGGYEITPEEKLKEDIYYIKNRSILLDFKILFKTVKVVLTGDGAR